MIEPQVDIKLYYKLGIAHIKLFWFLWGTNFFDNLVHLTPDLAPEHEKRIFRLQSFDDFLDLATEVESEVSKMPGSTVHHWLLDIQFSLRNIIVDLENIEYTFPDAPHDYSYYSHPWNFSALIDKVASIYFAHQAEFKKAEDRLAILAKSERRLDWAVVFTELESEVTTTSSKKILAKDVLRIEYEVSDDGLHVTVKGKAGKTHKYKFQKKGRFTKQISFLLMVLRGPMTITLGEVLRQMNEVDRAGWTLETAGGNVKNYCVEVNRKLNAEVLTFSLKKRKKEADINETFVQINGQVREKGSKKEKQDTKYRTPDRYERVNQIQSHYGNVNLDEDDANS